VRRLCTSYNVVRIVYDAYQLHDMATRLMSDGIAATMAFPQGQQRLLADKQLYDNVRDRRLVHYDDKILTEHVLNANMKISNEDSTLRIVKRSSHLKIDAAVALSMAAYEIRRLNVT